MARTLPLFKRSAAHVLLIMLALAALAQATTAAAAPRDVPSSPALSLNTTQCATDLEALATLEYPNALLMVAFATGKNLMADIGGYDYCRALSNARFCIITGEVIVGFPLGPLRNGFCVPSSCTGAVLNELLAEAEGGNSSFARAFAAVLPANTTVGFYGGAANCVDEEEHRWGNIGQSSGAIAALCVLGLLALLVVVGSVADWAVHFESDGPYRARDVPVIARRRVAGASEDMATERQPLLSPVELEGGSLNRAVAAAAPAVPSVRSKRSYEKFSKGLQFLLAFSVSRNMDRLFAPSPPLLASLNGVRVLSMAWIVYGHTPLFLNLVGMQNPLAFTGAAAIAPMVAPGTLNPYRGAAYSLGFQFVLGAEFAVDTFFFLSAALAAFLTLTSERPVPWGLYVFHRWWRLTPVFAFVMLVYSQLVPYCGSGPLWFLAYGMISSHSSTWWANLLYINSVYPSKYANMYMPWTWFLGVEMPLSLLVLPPVLIAYRRSRALGWAVVAALTLASLAYAWWAVATLELNNYVLGPDASATHDYGTDFYTKTWTRCPAYFVGVAFAFVLEYLATHGNRMVRIPALGRAALYALSAVLMVSTAFGLTGQYEHATASPWGTFSKSRAVVYTVLARPAWTLGLAILTYVFASGDGGLVAAFLSASVWEPLARLTFCAYLVHPVIMFAVSAASKSYFVYSSGFIAAYYALFLALAYGCALAIFVLIEKPLQNLEPLLLGLFGASRRGHKAK